jgi:hypothetical protein
VAGKPPQRVRALGLWTGFRACSAESLGGTGDEFCLRREREREIER